MPVNRIVYTPPVGFSTTWDFVAVHGVHKLPVTTLKEVENKAVHGVAFKKMGRKAPPGGFALEALAVNLADEATWIYNMSLLVGLQVRIYTSTGTWQNGVVVTGMDHADTMVLAGGRWGNIDVGSDARVLFFNMETRYPYGS